MTDTEAPYPYSNPDLVEVGPVPRPTEFARWGHWLEPEPAIVEALGPPLTYACRRASEPLPLDPRLTHPDWAAATWSPSFRRIEDGDPVELATSVALLWDDEALYAGFRLEDPDVRAVRTGFNDHVYVDDEDIELFVDLGPVYYELGVSPINISYQIRWVWLDAVVASGEVGELDRLFRAPNFLYFVPRPGAALGRHGDLDFRLEGGRHAVAVDGVVNEPSIRDAGWSAMFVLPWASLAAMAVPGHGPRLPPRPGDALPMMSYRAHHDRSAPAGSPSAGWTWSPVGNGNVHVPERWVTVTFDGPPAV